MKTNKRKHIITAAVIIFCCIVIGVVYIVPNMTSEEEPSQPDQTEPQTSDPVDQYLFSSYMAYDIEEVLGGNPWKENMDIDTLPVFKNTAWTGTADAMLSDVPVGQLEKKAVEMAELLDVNVNEITKDTNVIVSDSGNENYIYSITAKCETADITVFRNGQIKIEFLKPVSISSYPPADHENRKQHEKVLDELLTRYSGVLSWKNPASNLWMDYSYDAVQSWHYEAYDAGAGQPDTILGFSFSTCTFGFNDKNELFIIWINDADLTEQAGTYPIITYEQAKEELLRANYITTGPEQFFSENRIKSGELVYLVQEYQEYYMPYYLFYIEFPEYRLENGLNTYGLYYVPAIQSEYLENFPKQTVYFN